jgi:hypothetical protein
LKAIATSPSTKDVAWIFTDSRSSGPEEATSALDYRQAALTRDSPFFSIVLQCNLEESLRRLQDVGRRGLGSTKLTDTSVVRIIREKEDIYHFGDEWGLELDVTRLLLGEVANLIVEHICRFIRKAQGDGSR